jgi:hypothetical protein
MPSFRYNSNNLVVPPQITMTVGDTLHLKLDGELERDAKAVHFIVNCDNPRMGVVEITSKSDPKNSEQAIVVTAKSQVQLIWIKAYGKDGKPSSQVPSFAIKIEPKIVLPPENTEAGVLARMLIAENIMPSAKSFTTLEDSMTAMQWMRIVLENRLNFSYPHTLQVPNGAKTFMALIKSKGVVEGFEAYPVIAKGKGENIRKALEYANKGTHPKFSFYRGYVQNAIDVATGRKKGTEPCPKKLYGWMTIGAGSPGKNFEVFKDFGGQTFYTLTDAFLADPLQRKEVKK